MGAQLFQMGMNITDVIMTGRYSSVDLAGVALGSSVMWPVLILMMGVIQAVTPMVAQLNGAKNYTEIGEVIRQGLWVAFLGGLLGSLVLFNVAPLYRLADVDPASAIVSIEYLSMTAYGFPAVACFFCLRYLCDGIAFTRAALLIAATALALKIPLNYVLIYGHFGLPELGGVGCGVAHAILMWTQLLLILFVVTRKRFDDTNWMGKFSWPEWSRIKSLLIIGFPIGLTLFAEVGIFSLTTLLLGRYGAEVVASHNIAMSIAGFMFMLPLALGHGSTIRIGFRVGAGEIKGAGTTAGIALSMTVLFAIVGALFVLMFREHVVAIFTTDPAVRKLSVVLVLFVVFFMTFDAAQTGAIGCLRGFKDTRVPMIIALFSYWVVGLPLQCTLGFGWVGEPMGVYGFWIGLSVCLGIAAVLLCGRLWYVYGNEPLIRSLSG